MFPLTLLSMLALASPISAASYSSTISAADLEKISPDTSSCEGADFPDECATAAQAAPFIDISFSNFGIESFGGQAALVAIMLFESGDFKYKINHYPGVAGQGTRNMQSPAFNLKYAEWLSSVCSNCGISTVDIQKANAVGPAAVLDLVNELQWSFGSAAWFLKTQCDSSYAESLADGQQASFEGYLTGCVGTTVTSDRIEGWKKVIALGKWS